MMGHCPYCGAEMSENAGTCPRCKSYMNESRGSSRPLPRVFHPLAGLIVIVLISAGLAGLSFMKKPAGGPEKQVAAADDKAREVKSSDKRRQDKIDAGRRGRGRGGKGKRGGPQGGPSRQAEGSKEALYSRVVDYESEVMELLDRADELAVEMDELKSKGDKKSIQQMGDKMKSLHALQKDIRSMSPMPQLQYAHNHLARYISMLSRGYRRYMIYMQSREERQLELAARDMDRAEKLRERGLSELSEQKDRLAPPPPPEPEEPPEPVEPPEPADEDTVEPAESDTTGEYPPVPPPGEVVLEPGRTLEGRTVLDGDSVYVEEGGSVYYEEGGTVYYEEDATVYPEDSGTVYYEPGYREPPPQERFDTRY